MCVTVIFHKFLKNYPLIIGNNRDEMINRRFSPPQILNHNPLIYGPKDLERGGTWLGVNEHKILINILNKWTGKKNFFGSEKYISRGQLVLELLKLKSIEEILEKINTIDLERYLPFHLLVADKDTAFVIIKNKSINISKITDKIFILGNINPFKKWEKYKFGYEFFKDKKLKNLNDIVENLKILLSIHNGNKNIPSLDYAVDLGDFKTTSSSIVALNDKITFNFLNGFPGKGLYKTYIFE